MSTYSVVISVDASIVVKVEADSEAEAKEKAFEQSSSPRLCHRCSHDLQLGDPIEALEATLLEGDDA